MDISQFSQSHIELVLKILVPCLFLTAFLSVVIIYNTKKNIKKISDFSIKLARGEVTEKLTVSSRNEMRTLADSLNTMADSLNESLENTRHERNQLLSILESITEGVLVTDGEGRIIVFNTALLKQFEKNSDPRDYTALEYFQNVTLHEVIMNALKSQTREMNEISFFLSSNTEKIFRIYTAPLLGYSDMKGSVSVFHDITKMRKLENMRKEFVANVSHEFKTPLTSILGYSETLLNGNHNFDEMTVRFLKKIEKSAKSLTGLVDEILQISRLEGGTFKLNLQKININSFLEDIVQDFVPAADKKSHELSLKKSYQNLFIHADTQTLKHIVANLIDNSIKYTPNKGTIEVGAKQQGQYVEIYVQDNGFGISPEDQERIFERFYRVDKSRSRDAGGTGLGLAIVKHLCQAHGAQIEVESSLKSGSCFKVKFLSV